MEQYFPDYSRWSHAAGKESRRSDSRACLVTPGFRMCVGGAGAASRSPSASRRPSQKRRARREAALDRVERAGELAEPLSRAGRWRLQQREQVDESALPDSLHTRSLHTGLLQCGVSVWQERTKSKLRHFGLKSFIRKERLPKLGHSSTLY